LLAIAHLLVHDQKKSFFKKFLHEPFPVESSLHLAHHLTNHINAEIVSNTIKTPQDVVEYLTWTYFYRRLRLNPNYYGLEFGDKGREVIQNSVSDLSQRDVNKFLSELADRTLTELAKSYCITYEGRGGSVIASPLGIIASFYYLSHLTIRMLSREIKPSIDYRGLLSLLSLATEYNELPVRHNEDGVNAELAKNVRFASFAENSEMDFNSPNVKSFLLLQTHFSRYTVDMMPIVDYVTDAKTVLDQTVSIHYYF
jgi:replicative superfamily II helicase